MRASINASTRDKRSVSVFEISEASARRSRTKWDSGTFGEEGKER